MFEPSDPDATEGDDATPVAGVPALDGLDRVPPAELVAVLSTVHPGDVADAYDLVELAAACLRLKAWADGIEVETAAALAAHPVCHSPEAARNGFSPIRAAGQLLAARLGLAPSTGTDRVAVACQLVDELPDPVAAMFRGEIDYPKAAALAVGVRALDPYAVARAVAVVARRRGRNATSGRARTGTGSSDPTSTGWPGYTRTVRPRTSPR